MLASAPSDKTARGSLDGHQLERLARLFRQEQGEQSLLPARAGPTPEAGQPRLTIKHFTVHQARVAVSPDCSCRLLSEALQSAQRWLTVYVYSISASYLVATRAREAGLLVKSKELSGHFAAVFDLDWSCLLYTSRCV